MTEPRTAIEPIATRNLVTGVQPFELTLSTGTASLGAYGRLGTFKAQSLPFLRLRDDNLDMVEPCACASACCHSLEIHHHKKYIVTPSAEFACVFNL
jgi:hypothetical protein